MLTPEKIFIAAVCAFVILEIAARKFDSYSDSTMRKIMGGQAVSDYNRDRAIRHTNMAYALRISGVMIFIASLFLVVYVAISAIV